MITNIQEIFIRQTNQIYLNFQNTWLYHEWYLYRKIILFHTCTPPYPIGPRNLSHSSAMSFHFHSKRCTMVSWPGTKWGSLFVASLAANTSTAKNVAVANIVVSLCCKMLCFLIYNLSSLTSSLSVSKGLHPSATKYVLSIRLGSIVYPTESYMVLIFLSP